MRRGGTWSASDAHAQTRGRKAELKQGAPHKEAKKNKAPSDCAAKRRESEKSE